MKKECQKCKTDIGFWNLKDGRIKCKNCGVRFTSNKKKIKISRGTLKKAEMARFGLN